jgi:hypothetical protein
MDERRPGAEVSIAQEQWKQLHATLSNFARFI